MTAQQPPMAGMPAAGVEGQPIHTRYLVENPREAWRAGRPLTCDVDVAEAIERGHQLAVGDPCPPLPRLWRPIRIDWVAVGWIVVIAVVLTVQILGLMYLPSTAP